MINTTNKITVYADGSCRNTVGGWGIYIEFNDGNTTKLSGYSKDTTNNKMELISCINALKYIIDNKQQHNNIEIIMDSQYVISGINTWITGWLRNNWKTFDKKAVKNKDLWIELLDLKSKFNNIIFTKCDGHSGVKGNDVADKLAQSAMRMAE
jgi:ribonuclease HI